MHMMITHEIDPDVFRWGLHHLDVCSLSNAGSRNVVTHYEADLGQVEHVREGFVAAHVNVDNDEVIAHALQEELSRVAAAEASGSSANCEDQASILTQDWVCPPEWHCSSECGNSEDELDKIATFTSYSSPEEKSLNEEDLSYSLDGEVEKRLNQMISIPHIPKVNGDLPSVDEETSDHQRLLNRLQLYDLVELKIQGDGNCQFRSLSDQFYRTPEHHKFVREQIINQLKSHPEKYQGYVPMEYDAYLKKMNKVGEWGDHVTLQAAADSYGVKIFVITSFKDTCYIEILPEVQKSKRVIFLSFWAEVHYNSIYPEGEMPEVENRKKKKWWKL
ncbi:OTU domain [Dillenia turbinata]|uniref:ubiquitinyl hydrolase 1 n=1 Tax=Dillenia turbinata TaxID=194707 RepID=A0AAN8ZG96_9MAGN